MKPFNKTTIIFIISLALIVVTGGSYAFFFMVVKDKNKSIAEFLAKNEELMGRESRLKLAESSIKKEQSNINKLSSYFIKESEVVAFAKKIEILGNESGAILSLELLEPGVVEGGIPILNFKIKARGGFQEVMKLMILLENYPTRFEWKSVNLARDDSGSAPMAKQNIRTPNVFAPQWILTASLLASNFLKE